MKDSSPLTVNSAGWWWKICEAFASILYLIKVNWLTGVLRCTDAVKNESSNLQRHALVSRFEEMVAEEESDKEIASWCILQKDLILASLKRVGPDQVDWLVIIVKEHGANHLRTV